jgi:hypothetical protein
MTNEDDMKETPSDKDETVSGGTDKAKKIAEKLESMGVTPSDKPKPEVTARKRKYSPLLITLLIAIPAAGAIVYMKMPDTFNKVLPSTTPASSAGDHVARETGNNHSNMPTNSAANYWNEPQGRAEWLAKQRADMEQRRLEFQRRNPEPEWVARQRAYMEQQESEFQKRNSENMAANRRHPSPPPEWINNKQADMERSMAQHQPNAWPQGRAPEYMRHPGMGSYQANKADVNHQVAPQNNNPVNANMQPQAQPYTGYNYPPNPYYNNAQQNKFVPYPQPYGGYGYPYR